MATTLLIAMRQQLRRHTLRIILSTFIGVAFYIYLYYSEAGDFPSFADHYAYLLCSILLANVIGLVIGSSDRKLNKALPWREKLATRFVTGIILNILLAIALILLGSWLFFGVLHGNFNFAELWWAYNDTVTRLIIVTTISVVIYSVIYFALFSYNEYSVAHIESAQLERKQLKLQYETLRSQLSPHYLFNCLNTISALIFKDADLAEDFIRRLAATYQYILKNNERRFVTLEEEIEFVKSYNYLLQVRFENNLHLEINLPPNIMDSKIPPLTIQMLVENAVKHNIISREHQLTIYISAIDNTDIRVTNTKTLTPADVSSFSVGLENIKKRYRFFTERKIRITNEEYFTVKLPVIRNNYKKSA